MRFSGVARRFYRRIARRARHRSDLFYDGILGTSLDLHLVCTGRSRAESAERVVLAEISRLEEIFSIHLQESELQRWNSTLGEPVLLSPELTEALEAAERWRQRTRGAFDPCIDKLTRSSTLPEMAGATPDGMRRPREQAEEPRWIMEADDRGRMHARKLVPTPVDLNGIAKGIIIDCATRAAAGVEGVHEVVVNIGGDLCHRGAHPARIGIADPAADAENAAPLATIEIRNEALATSGSYRRGMIRDGRHYSHILNPATARSAEMVCSASVIAPTAAEADVLATAFNVLAPEESIELADSIAGLACLIVDSSGVISMNREWQRRKHSTPVGIHSEDSA